MAVAMTERDAIRLATELVSELPPGSTSEREFLEAQFDRGLAWIQNPVGEGGLGADVGLQLAVNQIIAAAGGPDPFEVNPIGFGMCGPTVAAWGNDTQKLTLRPLFSGADIWCQLFSEPGAGSDVAGLATRAEPDGDGWVINGQKVWTTMAHQARFGLLIARTDPDAPKHRGLTAFILDMQTSGVDVRPLYQMTGEAEFNEVFFDSVRVPSSSVLGAVGSGWSVALTTLMNERVSIGAIVPARGSGPIAHLLEAFRDLASTDPRAADRYRDDVLQLWIRAETLRLFNVRLGQRRRVGDPGPEGSIAKVLAADFNKDTYSLLLNLLGVKGLTFDGYEKVRPTVAHEFGSPQKAFLRSRANSIEGGTTEIMRNIVAERLLGLPGDVRVGKDTPWREIPRN